MNETIRELKELKDEFSITNADIAIAVGVREQQVWRWFSGNSHNPQAAQETAIKKFVSETRAMLAEDEKKKMAAYSQVILDIIYSGEGGTFWARPKPNEKYSEASYPTGCVRKDVWYETFRQRCDVYGNDNLLLTTFNNLAQSGVIKILHVFIPVQRPLRMGEGFALTFEVGTATRSQAGQDTAFDITRSYRDQPLTGLEQIPDALRDPKAMILSMRKSREAGQRAMHGHYDLSKEAELHRENLEDQASQRQAQLQLVDIMKGGKKMTNDPIGSEFDTLPSDRLRTKKLIEIKRVNNSKAPMVFYNHDGSRCVVESGCTGIQTRLVHIKPLKVEKQR